MALAKAALERMQKQTDRAQSKAIMDIPPLENGDHLSRVEFERRYHAMPPHIKAELIEGVVYMSSPVRFRSHGKPHRQAVTLLGVYADTTPGVECVDNATFRLDPANEPQPDVALFIESAAGGQARVSADDYLESAPELIIEVAASTAAIDLHTKLDVYRLSGVREYIVWRVAEPAFDWFVEQDCEYLRLQPDARGILRSKVFPGLWLDTKALTVSDMQKAMATLQQGLASKEHAAFVKRLKAQRRRKTK